MASEAAGRPKIRVGGLRALPLVVALVVAIGGSGCGGGGLPAVKTFDAEALRAEASEARTDVAWLRRHVEVNIGVARTASSAESQIRFHLARLGTAETAAGPLEVALQVPPDARLVGVSAQVLSASSAVAVEPLETRPHGQFPAVDPDSTSQTLVFGPLPAGAVLDLVADFRLAGTLVSDARWLGAPEGTTREVLLSYQVPRAAVGAFQASHPKASPLVRRQGGKTLIALMQRDVAAPAPGGLMSRFVTRRASPGGFQQSFATSWDEVAAPYQQGLVATSKGYRASHAPPFSPPTGSGDDAAIRATYLWVRDRIQRSDAMAARWDAGRALPNVVSANDLQATDKVHLMAWLLDAAGIDHRLAVARPTSYPALDPAFPTPGAFEVALVWLPGPGLWLDPACQGCQPGEVRPALRGGQALVLPVDGAQPVSLPSALPAAQPVAR